jgi:hypothetical protein
VAEILSLSLIGQAQDLPLHSLVWRRQTEIWKRQAGVLLFQTGIWSFRTLIRLFQISVWDFQTEIWRLQTPVWRFRIEVLVSQALEFRLLPESQRLAIPSIISETKNKRLRNIY